MKDFLKYIVEATYKDAKFLTGATIAIIQATIKRTWELLTQRPRRLRDDLLSDGFRIGDWALIVKKPIISPGFNLVGVKGRIVHIVNDERIGLELQLPQANFLCHGCGDHASWGYGWYVPSSCLQKIY